MSTAIHVPPGGRWRYAMIDGARIAKAAVHDAGGGLGVFEIAPAAPMAPPRVSPWTGVVDVLAFALATATIAFVDTFDPQFPVAGQIGLWLVAVSGLGLTWHRA